MHHDTILRNEPQSVTSPPPDLMNAAPPNVSVIPYDDGSGRHWVRPPGYTYRNPHDMDFRISRYARFGFQHAPVFSDSTNALETYQGEKPPAMTLPIVGYLNPSDRLKRLYHEVNAVTPKELVIADAAALPDQFRQVMEGLHFTSWRDHPDVIPIIVDSNECWEEILAHEIMHIWLDFFEDHEDHRRYRDATDGRGVFAVLSVQSFVIDCKVQEKLKERGFSMYRFSEDVAGSLFDIARAMESGLELGNRSQESVIAALLTIPRVVPDLYEFTDEQWERIECAKETFERLLPRMVRLSDDFTEAFGRNNYATKPGTLNLIDDCLQGQFDYLQQDINIERDLIETEDQVEYRDKFPEMLPNVPPEYKHDILKRLVREGWPQGTQVTAEWTDDSRLEVAFVAPSGYNRQDANHDGRENTMRFYHAGIGRFLSRDFLSEVSTVDDEAQGNVLGQWDNNVFGLAFGAQPEVNRFVAFANKAVDAIDPQGLKVQTVSITALPNLVPLVKTLTYSESLPGGAEPFTSIQGVIYVDATGKIWLVGFRAVDAKGIWVVLPADGIAPPGQKAKPLLGATWATTLDQIISKNPGVLRKAIRLKKKQNKVIYTVKDGDKLGVIATRFNTTVAALLKLNPGIKNRNVIFPGQKIVVSVVFGKTFVAVGAGGQQIPTPGQTQPAPGQLPAPKQPNAPQQQVTQTTIPEDFATATNIEDLATVIMSEASIGNKAERTAVGWTVLNRMLRNKTNRVSGVHRAYARNQTPTETIRELAGQLLRGEISDITRGATHFYSPRSMPMEGGDTAGKDIKGGLEKVPGLAKRNYRPGWAVKFKSRPVNEARERFYKFFQKPGSGKVF